MEYSFEARRALKNLKQYLQMSTNGVKNIESAVKSYRAAIFEASNYDSKFGGSEVYTQLEKQFSTFRLPKTTEWENYTGKALVLVNKALETKGCFDQVVNWWAD